MRLINRLLLALAVATLAACNTVSGVGEDIQSGGEALTDTAEDTQQEL